MVRALRASGIACELDTERTASIVGSDGRFPGAPTDGLTLDARQSGTTARFLTAVAAAGSTTVRVEAAAQMRGRPMTDLVDALRQIGAQVTSDGDDGTLPFVVRPTDARGPARVRVPGDASSQFLSGLLLSGPLHAGGLTIAVTSPLVSRPYVDMTIDVMGTFSVIVERVEYESFHVPAGSHYEASELTIEPDASAASYFFGAAALTGGRVTVPGLGRATLQGDLAFVRLLERMGARVDLAESSTTVDGPATLHGIEADLANLSDMVPTLAVVAAFADSPTRITGVGFIRRKESDRIGNVVAELRRAGVRADEEDDGLLVTPEQPPHGATLQPYDDHRLAMAFALLGLRVEGIEIADPTCVDKTYPGYWRDLQGLQR
jgi:3-phosphoshikimate 1-carboxyvinyltransferase